MSDVQVIPEAAVEAAEAVLLGYTGGCTCHEGYAGRNLIDPECSYHDVPPEVARLILEAGAPHIRAQALEEAATDLDDKRLLSKAFHIFYPEWLRERADKLRPTP